MTADDSVELIAGTLKAWLNQQPGSGGSNGALLVTAEAKTGEGVRVELNSASPQGTNPAVKLLKVKLERHGAAPPGVKLVKNPHGYGSAQVCLRYEEAPAQAKYTDVTVENGSTSMSTKVEIAV